MASIRVPSNVTSMTFSVSGVKAPAGGIITGLTAAEATAFAINGATTHNVYMGAANLVNTLADGSLKITLPTVITAITIGGTSYTVTGTVRPFGRELNTTVPAAAGSTVLYENFGLVQG